MRTIRPAWMQEIDRRRDNLVGRPADGRARPHHAPGFEMNEDGLPVGLRLGLAVMLNALGR